MRTTVLSYGLGADSTAILLKFPRPGRDVPRRPVGPPGNTSPVSGIARYWTILRSLFGEPVPGLVTTPEVAPFTRAVATCAGVAEVCPAR